MMLERFTEDEIRIIERELMERKHVISKKDACSSGFKRVEEAVAKKYALNRGVMDYTWSTQIRSALTLLTDIATGNVTTSEERDHRNLSYKVIRRQGTINIGLKEYICAFDTFIDCILEIMQKGETNE